MTNTNWNRTNIAAFNLELEAVLMSLAEKHGLAASRAGGSFSANEYTTKVSFVVPSAAGATPEALDYTARRPFLRNEKRVAQ